MAPHRMYDELEYVACRRMWKGRTGYNPLYPCPIGSCFECKQGTMVVLLGVADPVAEATLELRESKDLYWKGREAEWCLAVEFRQRQLRHPEGLHGAAA